MTLFKGGTIEERRVVTRNFLLYQYVSRNDANIWMAPKYNPSSIDLCNDIAHGNKIDVNETDLNTIFLRSGFSCDISFLDNNCAQITFNNKTNEQLLIAEARLLLRVIKYGLENNNTRSAYNDMCSISNYTFGMAKQRMNSIGSRAVGLFLWDYCNTHGGLKRRNMISEAVNQLKTVDWQDRLARLNLVADEKRLRSYLKITNACIEAKKILPFNKLK